MTYDMRDPDPREGKLPVWAQNMMADARRRVLAAEKSAREARLETRPAESDMLLDRHGEIPIGLGVRPTVRVVITRDESGEPERWLDITPSRQYDNCVEISGDSSLIISPQVTNVIRMTTTGR